MRRLPTDGRAPAVERARRAWADMAREARVDVRTLGVHGALPALDRTASRERGAAAPTQMSRLVAEMRDAGLPREQAVERLTQVVAWIVSLTYDAQGAA